MRNVLALVAAVLLACGTSAAPAASPASTPAGTSPTPTRSAVASTAPAPSATPSRAPVASGDPSRADVLLQWDTGAKISDIDDVTDIITHLKSTPGIIDGFGDEKQITIAYDPRQITVDRIRRVLADMGFPTRSPTP